jgi:hypothetical protein
MAHTALQGWERPSSSPAARQASCSSGGMTRLNRNDAGREGFRTIAEVVD